MLREQLANAISGQLQSPLNEQLEKKFGGATPANTLPVDGVITSPIGWRQDPISGDMRFHKGTDIAAPSGSEIKAVADGVVLESGSKGSFGNVIVIQTEDGRKMLYGHNQSNLVSVGERVQRGEVIAQVGATGRATGPHVHFEVTE
jgi:murein DD-endopeptidase MepM/ murein hydrolase activator NlpD